MSPSPCVRGALVAACLVALSAACAPLDDRDLAEEADPLGTVESALVVPPTVKLENVSFTGTGCPRDTATASLSADLRDIQVTYREFIAELGPGLPPQRQRRSCDVTMTLRVPAGYRYSVQHTMERAYIQLDRKVRAAVSSAHFITGVQGTTSTSYHAVGPLADDHLWASWMGPAQAERWSPCGGASTLNLRHQVALSAPGASPSAQGLYANDSVDGEVSHHYLLTFQACP